MAIFENGVNLNGYDLNEVPVGYTNRVEDALYKAEKPNLKCQLRELKKKVVSSLLTMICKLSSEVRYKWNKHSVPTVAVRFCGYF